MFVKLFTQILDSSIADNRRLRHFFTDLLLCADCKGYIIMTPSAIARRIGASIEEVEWGISELEKPDPNSKTKDDSGKRIEPLCEAGYGWRILNYESYRALKDADQMREATRRRVNRHREKKKNVTICNTDVTPCNANTEAEAEAEEDKETTTTTPKSENDVVVVDSPTFEDVEKFAQSQGMMISTECAEAFFDEMEALQWTYKGQPCVTTRAWQARFRKFATYWHNNRTNPRPFSK